MNAMQAAFLWACGLDVAVRKPGNVSFASGGHDMVAQQFLTSARVSAPALCEPGAAPGARLEAAVAATRAAVGCNTNLGILLLAMPLVCAAERAGERSCRSLRSALKGCLQALDLADAAAAYRAIALANPGGLGAADEEDVSRPPTVGLRAAMALAADRDLIARQYAEDYRLVFEFGLDAFQAPVAATLAQRVQAVYLAWLATHPDSHLRRKFGDAVAEQVRCEAVPWQARLARDPTAAEAADFARWDASLKARGLNPGTSADLTVCTLFVAALLQPSWVDCGVDCRADGCGDGCGDDVWNDAC